MTYELIQGDCLDVMRSMPDDSVDSVVTDPPAGISFMAREWDSDRGGRDAWIAWLSEVLTECNRVMKPGAHALIWAIPRTSHWTGMAIENAGLDVRDVITHLFGSGFPKSANISKHIDRMAGAEREVVGTYRVAGNALTSTKDKGGTYGVGVANSPGGNLNITAPATLEAEQWEGWGTALKPSAEFWFLARKPLAEKSIAANVLAHGTGAINVDATRVQGNMDGTWGATQKSSIGYHGTDVTEYQTQQHPAGRWPPNTLLSTSAAAALDAQSGVRDSGGPSRNPRRYSRDSEHTPGWGNIGVSGAIKGYPDSGGASRFFPVFEPEYDVPFRYISKASRAERQAGVGNNAHPT